MYGNKTKQSWSLIKFKLGKVRLNKLNLNTWVLNSQWTQLNYIKIHSNGMNILKYFFINSVYK